MTDWKPRDPERRKKSEMECKYEDQITDMHKAIYGNGTPTHGLYWMVEKNTEFIQMVRQLFWPLVIACLIGSASAVVILIKETFLHLHAK